MPTLLDIYDAIYAKFTDEPGQSDDKPTDAGGETSAGDRTGRGDLLSSEQLTPCDNAADTPPSLTNHEDLEETNPCVACGGDSQPSKKCTCPISVCEMSSTGTDEHNKPDARYPDSQTVNSGNSLHPTTHLIPPKSPHDSRKISTASSSTSYRPLSSISSSSSSSSNSLPRWQTGLSTMSYLASVESLVEQEDCAKTNVIGKRRERSLKARRDLKAQHLSRPGEYPNQFLFCSYVLFFLDQSRTTISQDAQTRFSV